MGVLELLTGRRPRYDAGRERDAEAKARELMRSVVSEREFAMYEELGFVSVEGSAEGYGYLLYPHRPIVAYETATDRVLTEYCVRFEDRSDRAAGTRLPDADDVLAKWMSLRGGERELIATANMDAPGRQHDPAQVERDLRRLGEWEAATRPG
jgi:hypothetical protein